MQKGQAAVELLIILAVSMVALIAIYGYSFSTMTGLNKQGLLNEAQSSVNSLATAADDVYRQGIGARKEVFFSVPSGVDQDKSGIENDVFILNVLDSDVFAKPETCLLGEIPTGSGGHRVWLTAQSQCVFVGTERINVDKTSSYVTLAPSETELDSVTVTNNGSEITTIFVTQSWTHTGVTLAAAPSTFSLNAGQQQTVTLTYASTASAAGNYVGSLKVNAYFASFADENIFLPANAEIVVPETNLLLFPPTYSTSLRENDSETVDLNVCNNTENEMTGITFSDSGDIDTWIAPIDGISSLGSGACIATSFTITVPDAQAYGNYTGSITAVDDEGNVDSTGITVSISRMSDSFAFDWSTASFSGSGTRLWEWTIENTNAEPLVIDKMEVSWLNDLDAATLEEIRMSNDIVWNVGGGLSGQELDITNFTVPGNTAYSSNNRFEYSQRVNNDSEDFEIRFTFNDGSTYTTDVYSP